jgi:hypothetical protein
VFAVCLADAAAAAYERHSREREIPSSVAMRLDYRA